ncbi:MAG: histone deacetylase [Gemmatimonadota bacterium]
MSVPLVYHPGYFCDIGPHVFPMDKYRLVCEGLTLQFPHLAEWVHRPVAASREQLQRVHTAEYLDDLDSHQHTMRTLPSELPISEEIVEAFYLMAGGSLLAAELALEYGAALNAGGGFHHAFADHAEGFCYVNDVALAVRHALSAAAGPNPPQRAAVVDCDLHQGNGTARIFQRDPAVFTFSIHQENNYPIKEKGSLDIGLGDLAGDDQYLEQLKVGLDAVFGGFGPGFVVYVAGVDPYEDDQLGGLHLTRRGMRQRDDLVLEYCWRHGAPVAAVLAGGYAFSLAHTVEMHMNTYLAMYDRYRQTLAAPGPSAAEG